MALQECKECGKPVSTEARDCPHCTHPMVSKHNEQETSVSLQVENNSMGTLPKILLWIVGLFIVGLFIAFITFVAVVGNTPAAKEKRLARSAISLCWDDQNRKSLELSKQRFIAGACEKMESDFTQKYGVRP